MLRFCEQAFSLDGVDMTGPKKLNTYQYSTVYDIVLSAAEFDFSIYGPGDKKNMVFYIVSRGRRILELHRNNRGKVGSELVIK